MPAELALPASEPLESYLPTSSAETDEWRQVNASLGSGLFLDVLLRFRSSAAPLICLLPSAQPRSNRRNPVYHRWTWAPDLPEANIAVLSEPTLYASEDLLGGWLMHSDLDLPREVSGVIREIVNSWGGDERAVLFYGSSMGGFEAMQLAAVTPGSRCVAEVPQIDMINYEFPQALESIESAVLTTSFMRHRRVHPEQVSVVERFRHERLSPPIRFVTNLGDHGYSETLASVVAVSQLDLDSRGPIAIEIWPEPVGHTPLPQAVMTALLRRELADLTPEPVPPTIPHLEQTKPSTPADFRQLLNKGIELADSVELTRTPDDRVKYDAALEALFAAASADPTQDLPLLRACSLMKVWDMNYSHRFHETAREALSRRETIAAASFVCRGLLASLDSAEADASILALREGIKDSDIRSAVDIFRAIAHYNSGRLEDYAQMVGDIRSALRPGFETYLLVPFSTVILNANLTSEPADEKLAHEFERISTKLPAASAPVAYTAVVSCDPHYLRTFGRLLLTSFEHTCEPSAQIVVVVLGSREQCSDIIDDLEIVSDRCRFVFADIDPGQNLGPIASLARFMIVPALLQTTGAPVVLMDIDAVVLRDLQSLIGDVGENDIGVRILGSSPAPWEMYAAGIVVFQPTKGAFGVADFVRRGGISVAKSGPAQWWIDQNALEFGIRQVMLLGDDTLRIHDLMGKSNVSLVLPTGPEETKVKVLQAALDRLLQSPGHTR